MDPLLPLLFAIALSLYLSLSSSRWYSDWHLRVTAETLLPHRPRASPTCSDPRACEPQLTHDNSAYSSFYNYNIKHFEEHALYV